MLRLLKEIAFTSVAAGASSVGFALLFWIMTEASAAAFFCFSRAFYVLSGNILPAATCFGFFAGRVVAVGEIACCVVSAAGVSGCCCCCCCCCCSVDIVPMQMLRLTLNSRLLVAQKLLKIVVHLFSSCCALLRNFFSLWLSSSRSKSNVLLVISAMLARARNQRTSKQGCPPGCSALC